MEGEKGEPSAIMLTTSHSMMINAPGGSREIPGAGGYEVVMCCYLRRLCFWAETGCHHALAT